MRWLKVRRRGSLLLALAFFVFFYPASGQETLPAVHRQKIGRGVPFALLRSIGPASLLAGSSNTFRHRRTPENVSEKGQLVVTFVVTKMTIMQKIEE